jgi:hypothetical protein
MYAEGCWRLQELVQNKDRTVAKYAARVALRV